jgi:hypothetical protein
MAFPIDGAPLPSLLSAEGRAVRRNNSVGRVFPDIKIDFFALIGDYVYRMRGDAAMASTTDHEIRAIALSSGLGRSILAFDDDEILSLLRAAIQREGGQVAFAKHHSVNRTYLNMVLSGKRPMGDAIAEALGLRKVYVAEKNGGS